MAKTNAWENALLQLLFNNITAAGIGDMTGLVGSTITGSLYVSLHTADPTIYGNQSTYEATYGGYARVAVIRTVDGWTISGSNPVQVANTTMLSFPTSTGGYNVLTYVGVGASATGTGELLYSGILASPLMVVTNVTPSFTTMTLIITES